MKAVTIVAAAGLVASASAASVHKHPHAHLHKARSGWNDWESSSSVDPADTQSGKGHTSKSVADPATSSATSSKAWENRSSSSSSTSSTTTTTAGEHCGTTTGTSTSCGTFTPKAGVTYTKCETVTTTATATDCSTSHWVDWEASTTTDLHCGPTTTSSCETKTVGPASKVITVCTTVTAVPEKCASTSASETWGEWAETTTTITLHAKPTATDSATTVDGDKPVLTKTVPASVVTSKVDPAWSSDGWFGKAWTVDPGMCAVSVITSYGEPFWAPVADPTTTVSSTWADWTVSASSVDPSDATSTTWADWSVSSSADPSDATSTTWADWSVSSSADPSAATSTTWADWSVSSSADPSAATSTTWADWSVSSSADPSAATSTTWADWSVSSSADPSAATSTTWADWSASSSSSSTSADPGKPSGGWGKPSDGSSVSTSTDGGNGRGKPSTASSAAVPTGTGINKVGGKAWAMTYSPFTADSKCKDAATVDFDVAKMAAKGFSSVRVYSTDCNTLQTVGDACRKHNMKIILGVFVNEKGIDAARPQVAEIAAWKQWDLVELIVVGNEALYNGYCTAEALAWFISSASDAFKAAGYTGSVTTTEPLNIWEQQGSKLCNFIDVVSGNLYAFFNPTITADKAGDFIQAQINIMNKICPGKDSYVMESGWPSHGSCNGVACPSPENQATAVKGIQDLNGAKVVFFSYEDEAWKKPGPYGVEQFWGCADVF